MPEGTIADLLAALSRIEQKLDTLIQALAEDGEEPERTLDGDTVPGERDQTQSL